MSGTTDDKVRCTNCKCWREKDAYIGKKGGIVKRCLICREKDARQKSKEEVKAKRNIRNKEKQYYNTYRKNQREKDEEGYLAHNAEVAKLWRDKNKEHLSAWRAQNHNTRITSIKQQASKKGISWDDNMTYDVCKQMVESNCYYCNAEPTKTLNGIDRMDSTSGYHKENCVACCKTCNFIKRSLDANTFLQRCLHISSIYNGEGEINLHVWRPSKSASYASYVTRALQKGLRFDLSHEEFEWLVYQPCVYCKRLTDDTHKNGVDRQSNTEGYIHDNCVSCCGECNSMKGTLSSVNFIDHCKRVANYMKSANVHIPSMPKCLKVITKRVVSTI